MIATAPEVLMLAAQSMGYSSSPMDMGDVNAVAKLINLPEDHVIAMYVAIGKSTGASWPRGGQLAYEEVVRTDRL